MVTVSSALLFSLVEEREHHELSDDFPDDTELVESKLNLPFITFALPRSESDWRIGCRTGGG